MGFYLRVLSLFSSIVWFNHREENEEAKMKGKNIFYVIIIHSLQFSPLSLVYPSLPFECRLYPKVPYATLQKNIEHAIKHYFLCYHDDDYFHTIFYLRRPSIFKLMTVFHIFFLVRAVSIYFVRQNEMLWNYGWIWKLITREYEENFFHNVCDLKHTFFT